MATKVTAQQVAAQVAADGGTTLQQQVAAALVSGVESNGDPTELSGGIGPAAGLFQFEPATWIGNGGGQYANVAQDATWQEQVAVFVNATKGDNFGDWGPDLGGSYGYSGPPKAGSPVANKITELGSAITGAASSANPTGEIGQLANDIPGYSLISGAASDASSISGLISDITSPTFWERIGMGALGVALFGVGLAIFFASTNTGKKAISDGAQLAPLAAA